MTKTNMIVNLIIYKLLYIIKGQPIFYKKIETIAVASIRFAF